MELIKGIKVWDISDIPERNECRMELMHMVRFGEYFYVGYHEGIIHHDHPDGRARVIRSRNGRNWETAALLDWNGADVREPRLSVTADGQLMINTSVSFVSPYARDESGTPMCEDEALYIREDGEKRSRGRYFQLDAPGTPESDEEARVTRQSVTWLSRNGLDWDGPFACPSGVNTWRWDTTWYNGMGYSIGYAGKDRTGTLYRTRDGRSWRALKYDFFPNSEGSEAALAFDTDHSALCLLRSKTSNPTFLGIGHAPYYQYWTWKPLLVDCVSSNRSGIQPSENVFKSPLGGPGLIRLSDGRYVAVGRMCWPWSDGNSKISLFWLDPQQAVLTLFAEIDGGSYAGVVEHDEALWVACCGGDYAENGYNVVLAKIHLDG